MVVGVFACLSILPADHLPCCPHHSRWNCGLIPAPARPPHIRFCVCVIFFGGGWQVAAKGKGIISNQFLDRVDQAWYNRSAKFDRGAKLQVYRCHYYGTSTVEGNDFEEAEEMVGLCL